MLTSTPVADTGNVLIDALTWGSKWLGGIGPLKINVGFKLIDGLIPTLAETTAVQTVLAEFERVINVDFTYIGIDRTNTADLTFQIKNDAWDASYGWSVPPGSVGETAFGDANILRNNYVSSGAAFEKGSFDYITFLHEFAHVMGLAHPHDDGGGSGLFPGVTGSTVSGYFDLNQGGYTTMSYNDGLKTTFAAAQLSFLYQDDVTGAVVTGNEWLRCAAPNPSTAFGLQGGLMALDILALQNLYGANTNFNADGTFYILPAQNAKGTAYVSIWDTGGSDTIFTDSVFDAVIDLRAASGQVVAGGGGYVSSLRGVSGGFTIANGVTIENATSGSGNDIISGNAAANLLTSNGGDDILTGYGGRDEFWGGTGHDTFVFTSDLDSGPTVLSGDVIKDFNPQNDIIDLIGIDANSDIVGNQSFHFLGAAASFVSAGDLRVGFSGGNTVLYLNTDADMSSESVIVLTGVHTLTADDFLL